MKCKTFPISLIFLFFFKVPFGGFTGAQLTLAWLLSCPAPVTTALDRDDSRISDGLWEMEREPGQGGKLVRAQWDDGVGTKAFGSPLDRKAKLLFLRISRPPRKKRKREKKHHLRYC